MRPRIPETVADVRRRALGEAVTVPPPTVLAGLLLGPPCIPILEVTGRSVLLGVRRRGGAPVRIEGSAEELA